MTNTKKRKCDLCEQKKTKVHFFNLGKGKYRYCKTCCMQIHNNEVPDVTWIKLPMNIVNKCKYLTRRKIDVRTKKEVREDGMNARESERFAFAEEMAIQKAELLLAHMAKQRQ